MSIRSLIRTIPDYPKPGILFRDITTLLRDPKGLRMTVDGMVERTAGLEIDKVAGIEARGFILAPAIAIELGLGFVPMRKRGKLPGAAVGEEYTLEYGTDAIEVHVDAIEKGDRVLLIDDLIATGGTALAGIRLIERVGAHVAACGFVVDLPDLGGSRALVEAGHKVFSLCEFEGD